MHSFHFKERTKILKYITSINITENIKDVSRPLNRGRPISGLPIHTAFQYLSNLKNYRYLSVNKGIISKHHRTKHRRGLVAKGRPIKGTKNEVEYLAISI
jgi:hypothetical protein